jgi:TonB family protein
MRNFFPALFMASTMLLLPAVPAFAKTPAEVKALYKDYRAALKSGDKVKASDVAYEAWQAAEKKMGDHKTTGDLAYNFAQIDTNARHNSYKLHKKREKAFQRAVELVKFYEMDREGQEIDRRLKLAAHGIALGRYKKGEHIPENRMINFHNVRDAIEKYNKAGTTYEADYHSLLARFYEKRQDYDQALIHANKAIEIFNSRTDDLTSGYFYFVKLFKANILSGTGEKIPAALQYQEIMQNLEGALEPDHPFIKKSFAGWMVTRSELDSAGRLDEAEAAGLCECWPFENYKNKPLPLERVPPVMPRTAKRSGHVNVIFDINASGKPINVSAISTTDRVFVKPALKSVEEWQYSPADDDVDPELRKDIATKITFNLKNRRGEIIKEGQLYTLE